VNPNKLELVRQWTQTGHPVMVSAADTAKFTPPVQDLNFLAARPTPKRSRRRASRRRPKILLGLAFTALLAGSGVWAYKHAGVFTNLMAASRPPAALGVAEAPPQRMIVASDVMQSLINYRTMPVYPEAARGKNIEGGVLLDTVIGKDGRVLDVQLISGPPELASAAMDAVRNWRFSPFTLNGSAVEVETTIEVAFRLKN
jgi:TonB family protein